MMSVLRNSLKSFCILGVLGFAFSHPAEAKNFTPSTVDEIQAALDEAGSNSEDDVIEIQSGEYFPQDPLILQNDDSQHNLTIYGKGKVILDGAGSNPTELLVINGSLQNAEIVLSKLTFQNVWYGEALNLFLESSFGSFSNNQLRIEQCSFLNNKGNTGPAMRLDLKNVSLILNRNIFKKNTNAGVGAPTGGAVTIDQLSGETVLLNNVFQQNDIYGAEISDHNSAAALTYLGQSVYLQNNSFIDNHHSITSGLLKNYAAVQLVASGKVALYNNLFYNNEAQNLGPLYPDPVYRDIKVSFAASIEVSHNSFVSFDVYLCADLNNCPQLTMSSNFNFLDPLLNGYHLKSGSPAIDVGTTLNLPVPIVLVDTDIDGQARWNGMRPDIGADEFHVQECGNGILEVLELCDDGNNQNGDGCSSNCTLEIQPKPFFDKDPFEGDPYPPPSPKEVEPLQPVSQVPILQRP